METIKKVLSDQPFFKGMDEEYVATLAGCAVSANYAAEQFLFRQGEESEGFFVILRGKVALQIFTPQQGPIIIETLGEGDVLGWTWIVAPFRRRFDAQALEDTRALVLDGKSLRGICDKNHNLGYQIMTQFAKVMAQRLEAARLRLLDVYGIPAPKRKS